MFSNCSMEIHTKDALLECDLPSDYPKDRSNSAVFLVVILGYLNTMKTRKKIRECKYEKH